ncbi:MAG: pyridoxal phosphate-dependent aminotransferase [Thermoanaerobaculia bacterium]|nr:pyridoxal phosphate-dependent aminotransferase [Thermoanaerobaculia bacterium]
MPRCPGTAAAVAAMPGSVYTALAHRLAAHRGEVYPLHVGDTWMEPLAGCRMQDLTVEEHPGLHRYAQPQGLPSLLDAIVERHRQRTGVATEREQILVTAGATGALGAVAGALLDPGEEVLILAPYWPLISGIVRGGRGVPVPVPFFGEADSSESAVEIVESFRSERTVALYLNTPNNPTGRAIPAPWLHALAEWARRHDLWLLADEVYEEIVYRGEHVYTRPLAPERTFSVHSFSKAYGMAGNRCGYLVGPADAMAAARKVSTHAFYSTPTASQVAAQRVLSEAGDRWVASARERYRELGREAAERLGVETPDGSTFLFVDAAGALDESGLEGFLGRCVDRGLFVAPGPSFGPYPTWVRVCFTAAEPPVTRRGIDLLARLLGR